MNKKDNIDHLKWKLKFYEDILLRPLETPIMGDTYDRFIWFKVRYDALNEFMKDLNIK